MGGVTTALLLPQTKYRSDFPMSKPKIERVKLSKLVQFQLLPEDVKKLEALVVKETELWSTLQGAMSEGWHFDVIKNDKDNDYSVLSKQGNAGNVNSGAGFYSRGNTVRAALICALYKLELIEKGELDAFLSGRNQSTSFG